MLWNWQQPDWPHFRYAPDLLSAAEERFLLSAGAFGGMVKHLESAEFEQLTIELISTEALTTSEIEGEFLDRPSVQSSIRRAFGLATDHRRAAPAEAGIAQMMVDLYRSTAAPLTAGMLHAWHGMLMQGRTDLANIGHYRTSPEPMQVVSGSLYAPRIHFEAPPSAAVPDEMARFIEWFNATPPSLARAATAHLYFESIHPYEDGNGRIGRAISEKALAQAAGQPTLTALATTILQRRKAYYLALEQANKTNDITHWLTWFADTTLAAQAHTQLHIEFIIHKTRLLNRLRDQLNDRQQKALLRIFREGPTGFTGGLSASNYMSITGASPATTTRDLADLVAKGALTKTGELRHARYSIALPTEHHHAFSA